MGKVILALILFAAPSYATTRAAAGCSTTQINDAVVLSSDGDTVTVPAGTCVWTGALTTVTKGISIIGAGIGQTIISDDLSTTVPAIVLSTTAGKAYRLSGFTFNNAPASRGSNSVNGLIQITGASSAIVLDHIKFDFPTTSKHLRFVYWTEYTRGVMSAMNWDITSEQGFTVYHNTWAGGVSGEGSWAAADQAGSAEMVYCEDSILAGNDAGGLTDGFAGARFAVRHCTIVNGHIGNHGTESTGRARGTRWMEVYENAYTKPMVASQNDSVDFRSGGGVVFNNTSTGTRAYIVKVVNYRSGDLFNPWGMADGTNPFDSNLAGGPFWTGTHTGSNDSATVQDTAQTWTVNALTGYSVRRIGISGTASAGSGTSTLVLTGATWTVNQWANYIVRNTTTGRSRLVSSNTADTITVVAGDGPMVVTAGDGFQVYYNKGIASNTVDTITCIVAAFASPPAMAIDTGDSYEIWKTTEELDMPGMGQSTAFAGGTSPTPVAWPTQAVSPVYEWGNTFTGLTAVYNARLPVLQNTHYYIETSKPGYTPYTYPHPLVPVAPGGRLTLRMSK